MLIGRGRLAPASIIHELLVLDGPPAESGTGREMTVTKHGGAASTCQPSSRIFPIPLGGEKQKELPWEGHFENWKMKQGLGDNGQQSP